MARMRKFNNGFSYNREQLIQVTPFHVGAPNEQYLFSFSDGVTSVLTDEGEILETELFEWLNGTD